ncbi:filamin-B-like [Penaeus japonicus]|uniref:filamin-B-like n=1 Tax=Penaeus japonicus TaxID=27405 RepID=UPI001C7126D9|nr:filamin-B-like [Penaeus japonicus]
MKVVSSGERTTLRGTMATMEPNLAAITKEWLWWTWSWLCSLAWSVRLWWVEQWDLSYPYLCLAWMFITTSVVRGQNEEKRLLTWVQELVPTRSVKDLDRDLADGVALCGLMQALVPGTCPRHDLLPPDQPAGNIRLAARLASTFLGVTQDLAWERMQGRDGHRILMKFLRNLRFSSLKREVLGGPAVTHDSVVEALGDYQVLARGMGLQMAMVGRRTKFTLYLNNSTTLDLVVEIKNDEGDYCSHRITNRSPLRSRVLSKQALKERHNIPLEYEVSGSEVRVAWIPLQEGLHTLSIIWRGQHVVGSPYSVVVDDSQVRQ